MIKKSWSNQLCLLRYCDFFIDFPEILRWRNRDLETTHNTFRGNCVARLVEEDGFKHVLVSHGLKKDEKQELKTKSIINSTGLYSHRIATEIDRIKADDIPAIRYVKGN